MKWFRESRLFRFMMRTPQFGLTVFNGLRRPPGHLPEEQQRLMIKQIGRAQIRSWKFWFALAGLIGCGIAAGLVFSILPRRFHPLLADVPIHVISFTAILIVLMGGYAVLVVKPINANIVATIWREHHLCPVCDYDCRLSPDRCPECGTLVRPAD